MIESEAVWGFRARTWRSLIAFLAMYQAGTKLKIYMNCRLSRFSSPCISSTFCLVSLISMLFLAHGRMLLRQRAVSRLDPLGFVTIAYILVCLRELVHWFAMECVLMQWKLLSCLLYSLCVVNWIAYTQSLFLTASCSSGLGLMSSDIV